jgi:hypothetical protein
MKFWFDMDGTIADFYNVDNWLAKVESEDTSPYAIAEPMSYIAEIIDTCKTAIRNGHTIGVITWGAMNATPEYNAKVAEVKKIWLDNIGFPYTEFYFLPYGKSKHKVVKEGILIDDNEKVCEEWYSSGRDYINAQRQNITTEMKKILMF